MLEEIKTEAEVKRVCSGFGEANASDYGPNPTDSSNVYGPGAGNAAAATAAIASAAAGATGASGAAGATRPSWASQTSGIGGNTGGALKGGQENAAKIAAQISAQVCLVWFGGREEDGGIFEDCTFIAE